MNKSNKQQRVNSPLLFLVILLTFSLSLHAQEVIQNKPLDIGDQVPELVLKNVINHSDSVIRIADLEGKLVILSFWATWCKVCIEQLPKMEALQQEFGDQILILPVTKDDAFKVSHLLQVSTNLNGIRLPFVTNTDLTFLFPHKAIPHEIWIDASRKVVAITGHEEVTADNIRLQLHGDTLGLARKRDIMNYDLLKPLIAGGLGSYQTAPHQIKYSRMITSYIPGLISFRSNVIKIQDRVTLKCTNTTIQDLYVQAIATNPHEIWPDNQDFYLRYGGRLIWEASDSTFYSSLETRKNPERIPDSLRAFNYEIILPRLDSARINSLMLQDLNDYFGHHYNIVGRREKRLVDCWTLVCTNSSIVSSKGDKRKVNINTNSKKIQVSNISVDEFLFRWQNATILMYFHPIPIINETGIIGTIDLDINVDPGDFEAVKKAISAYGLEFRLEKRLLDMIVIRDKVSSK